MRKLSDNDFNALINGCVFHKAGVNAKRRKAIKMAVRAHDTHGAKGWPALAVKRYGPDFLPKPAPHPIYAGKLTPKARVLAEYPDARLVWDHEDGGAIIVKGGKLGVTIGYGPTANAAWAAAAKAV